MHIDFALPIGGSHSKGFQRWRQVAERSVMDYGFHMAVTHWNDEVGNVFAAEGCVLTRKFT